MELELKQTERLDDLQCRGYKIIQEVDGFCFGIDSVLLANFAKEIKKDAEVIDLGTGTGIIPTLLCAKTNAKNIIGVEIQKQICDMARRSIIYNNLEKRFQIKNIDVNEIKKEFLPHSFDVVITNPPYKKKGTGLINEKSKKEIARHETTATLEDFIKQASFILKDKGEFYIVHKVERLVDIFYFMRKYKIEPKLLQMVSPKIGKEPNLVLIKGIKSGRSFLKMKPTLYLYDDKDQYTKQLKKFVENKQK